MGAMKRKRKVASKVLTRATSAPYLKTRVRCPKIGHELTVGQCVIFSRSDIHWPMPQQIVH